MGNLLPLSLAPAVGRALGRPGRPQKDPDIFIRVPSGRSFFAAGNLLQTLMQVRLARFLYRQIWRAWVSGLAGLDLSQGIANCD